MTALECDLFRQWLLWQVWRADPVGDWARHVRGLGYFDPFWLGQARSYHENSDKLASLEGVDSFVAMRQAWREWGGLWGWI